MSTIDLGKPEGLGSAVGITGGAKVASATGANALVGRTSIAYHSKSFALASRALPGHSRDHVASLYAWCRYVDDAIDESPKSLQAATLLRLNEELRSVYAAGDSAEALAHLCPLLREFATVVHAHRIPVHYPQELLAGLQMDVEHAPFQVRGQLGQYCYRVAGVVGLMMTHVLGVSSEKSLPAAAKLGLAMQLTNICRDVSEDFERGRLYLPRELYAAHGAEDTHDALSQLVGARNIHRPLFPEAAADATALVVRDLLQSASTLYQEGIAGIGSLPLRASIAVDAAQRIYSEIGRELEKRRCDVRKGRAVVSKRRKLVLLSQAIARGLSRIPGRLIRQSVFVSPAIILEYNNDLFCT